MKRITILALVFGLLGAAPVWSVEITSGPTLTMNPNGLTPLAGLVELTTDVPTRVTLTVSDGVRDRIIRFPEFLTDHSEPLLGLAPNGVYTIEVTVTDEENDGSDVTLLLTAVTDPLPDDFPLIDVLASNPDAMEPGLTMLDRIGLGRGVEGTRYLIILNNAGQVVWYATFGGSAMIKLPNGNLIYRNNATAVERDMLGNEVHRIELADPGDQLHHDLFPTADGTFLSLTRQTVSVDGYPTSETDPNAPTETADVLDEPVVVFGPDGSLLNTWSLVDMLDSTRISYSSLNLSRGVRDWGHANAVAHDPRDDSIIVSVRHQDAVIKFSRATGELIWILGPHDNWISAFQPFLLDPVGTPFKWPFHMHAPMITSFGTVMMFDNGNYSASPFDGRTLIADDQKYSRAVEYSIDEDTMEIEQIWEYGSRDTDWLYANFIGDVDRLPITGNVLITFGGTRYQDGVAGSDLGLGAVHTRIIEVDHATPAAKVFDVRVYNSGPDTRVYRSDRIPSLYSSAVTESLDSDSDGIGDNVDACFLTAPGEVVNAYGCSVNDLAPCDNEWKNHGEYVRNVVHVTHDFFVAGVIIKKNRKDKIGSTAGGSSCGAKK